MPACEVKWSSADALTYTHLVIRILLSQENSYMAAYETSATCEHDVLWLEVVLVNHLAVRKDARQPSPCRLVGVVSTVIVRSSRSRHGFALVCLRVLYPINNV